MATIPALLADDYRKTKRQLAHLEAASGRGQRIRPQEFTDLVHELEAQMTFEEIVVYPLLRLHVDGRPLSLVAVAEHRQIRTISDELRDGNVGDEQWWATMLVFADNLRRHIEREERELLPWLRRTLPAGMLREFANRYQLAKATALGLAQTSA